MAHAVIKFTDGEGENEVNMEFQVEGLEEGQEPTPALRTALGAWQLIKGVAAAQQRKGGSANDSGLILPPGADDAK